MRFSEEETRWIDAHRTSLDRSNFIRIMVRQAMRAERKDAARE